MNYVYYFMVVDAAHLPLALSLSEAFTGEAGKSMFTCPLSESGIAPASHFLTDGWIEPLYADLMLDADKLYAACQEVGASVTHEQLSEMLAASIVESSIGNPFTQAESHGLKVIMESQDA